MNIFIYIVSDSISFLPQHQNLTTAGPGHKFNTAISHGHTKFNATRNDDQAILVAYCPEKREVI